MWVVSFKRGRLLVLVGSLLQVGSCPVIQLGRWCGINVLTVFQNNDKRRILIRRLSFGCHITDSDVATCSMSSVYFACVVEALRSACWRAWCLSMDGEGRQRRATRVDDGGYVEGCGFRI